MTNGISFLGQTTAQTTRLLGMQKTMDNLLRQASSYKKYDTLSGFGHDSQRVLRLRADIGAINVYSANIDTATTRIEMMSNSMSTAQQLGESLMNAISGQVLGGVVEIESIQTIAKNNLAFLQTLANTDLDGRYLFAGTDTDKQPVTNRNTINTAMQSQVTQWLNGSITTEQMLANVSGMTENDIGMNPALGTSGSVSVQVDSGLQMDYTVMANDSGFDKLMKAMALAAALPIPDGGTDVPDMEEFTKALLAIENMAREGVAEMRAGATDISAKHATLKDIQTRQAGDKAVFQKMLDSRENVDQTEVLTQLQALQTQLQASFEVTRIVSQMSLVNYLPR